MGMQYAGARGPGGGAKAQALVPENGSQRADGGHRDRSPVSGLSSALCSLFSAKHASGVLGAGRGRALEKGIWWMPWHREAMKDVARCEKPRGGASARGSSDLRMGQPTPLGGYPSVNP